MYGDSHALSSDSSPILPSNSKQKQEQQLPLMESDYRQQQFGCNNSSSQSSSGLLRFRSAPTSLLANFTEKSVKLGFSRFCCDETNGMNVAETDDDDSNNKGFGGMNSQLPPQYPRQSGGAQFGYRVVSSIGRESQEQSRIHGSNLAKQNSSPAGFLSHLNSQNGYSGVRGIGSYRVADGGGNGELSPSSSRFKNHMNFSSVDPSLSRITEVVENENGGPDGLDEAKVGHSSGDNLFFSSGFPFGSWNDSSYFAENLSSGIKRELDIDPKLFVNAENGNRPNILSHHLSLPKTSAEMAAMEKLLQLQDTVPCKVRAKRGCATHPRSIAERVRRTRISERMRKLQELVPNMDKQTNTADMLDLAVDYIKGLQKQYKTLNDVRAHCKCSAFPKC
ncbi:hypothetical protein C2S52_023097 [Perilla frutescens var. hirtella]|nr:hypothetical protein C2S52_023097 [Perilla frutescens var. hirtella]